MTSLRPAPEEAILDEALQCAARLPGRLRACSRDAGWSTLLLRRYEEPIATEPFETHATPDQLIVLVKSGSTRIESLGGGRWCHADYVAGDIGMTRPDASKTLRWSGREAHETLQLHLPAAMLEAAAEEVLDGRGTLRPLDDLVMRDALVRTVMLELERAAASGLPDLYADTAGHLLAMHLVAGSCTRPHADAANSLGLARVDEYMRANLAAPLSLAEIARSADRSTFQLIRMVKREWGMTPFQYLTRLRMDHARHLLLTTDATTEQIARQCGYRNRTHFVTAFRRACGFTPQGCRARGDR